MAAESSFDVVSQFDRQEIVNAIDQAMREVNTRYDLKDTKSKITLEKDQVLFAAPSEFVLTAVRELLEGKLVRRHLSLKILDYGPEEPASGGRVTGRPAASSSAASSSDSRRSSVKRTRIVEEGKRGSGGRSRPRCS